MLSAADARRVIFESLDTYPAEPAPVGRATGRVLRQAVVAERDQPPFDRVTMDGIAIDYAAYAQGQRRFRIVLTQHAGDSAVRVDDRTACAEVMTGAVLPAGTDTVIPVERIAVDDGVAGLEADYVPQAGQFVHRRGSDHRQDTEVLSAGKIIEPVDVAVLVSCGLTDVRVSRTPVVRIISTGNELVPAGLPIEDHQVRLSNGPAMAAMLEQHGFDRSTSDHLPDQPEELERRIGQHLAEADVLILSGGVSMGKADFVPEVLGRLGVETVFHKIRQRPGRPMWFGKGREGQSVFALPGNPVSALVCCRQYVLPALLSASGRNPAQHATMTVTLAEDVVFMPALTCFLPIRLRPGEDGNVAALPSPTNTSGDFASLSGTDGYVELDSEVVEFPAGTRVPFHGWDRP